MHDSRLKVLVLPSWYPTAPRPGYGVFFREQAQALARSGVNVSVLVPEILPASHALEPRLAREVLRGSRESLEDGVVTRRVRGFAPERWPTARAWVWTAACEALVLRHCARHGRPDLIHAHGSAWPFSAGAWSARMASSLLGVPYLVTEHATVFMEGVAFPDGPARRIREALSGAARVIAVSRALADCLAPFTIADRLTVIGNLIDTAFFCLPVRRPERPTLLSVAGLVPRKGMDGLIRAFAMAFPSGDGPVLEIGGDGPERGALEAQAGRLGLSDRVRFLGQLDRAGIRAALWRSGLFVLNSRLETFGIVLAEALATGVPVVSTRCGGTEDVVGVGDGRLVPVDSPDALADALRETWASRHDCDPATLRARAVPRFGDEAVCGRLVSLYDEVLREQAHSTSERK